MTYKEDPPRDDPLTRTDEMAVADGRSRRRLRPGTRRDEILEAAQAVFSELGFDRTTLNDVAERAGVTKGAVYHYFD